MDQRLGYRINEFLLLAIIVIQLFDFFKALPPFWDYVNKIVNWVLIGSLLYLSSPSSIFFGERRRWWDCAVILSFFAMVLKNIISFAATARDEMLGHVMEYVAFVPTAAQVKAAVVIPVGEAAYNTFTLLGYLPNASLFAKPFATQITITSPSLGFTIAAGNQTANALLQPYGLDGLTFQLYNTILNNAAAIEETGFIVGGLLLLCLGLYAALRFKVAERSALAVLHEAGELKDVRHAVVRVLSVLLVIAAYFVVLFNLAVEWLAMAVDAPFSMVGIAAVVYLVLRSRRREGGGESLVDRVGNFGNGFLQGFGGLFEERKTVLLGLSGLLVLHLLTDVGNFILPYLTGLFDPLYFSHLGPGHDPLFLLIGASLTPSWTANAAIILLYCLNVVGILTLLTLPAYIWYKAFRIRTRPEGEAEHLHHPRLQGWLISLCLTSIAAFLLAPTFSLQRVRDASLVGVDLQTRTLSVADPLMAAGLLVLLFVVFGVISTFPLRKYLMALLFYAGILFFGYYTLLFFLATVGYYLREAATLLRQATASSLFLGAWLFAFLVINLLFYVFGYFSFVYEAHRE